MSRIVSDNLFDITLDCNQLCVTNFFFPSFFLIAVEAQGIPLVIKEQEYKTFLIPGFLCSFSYQQVTKWTRKHVGVGFCLGKPP